MIPPSTIVRSTFALSQNFTGRFDKVTTKKIDERFPGIYSNNLPFTTLPCQQCTFITGISTYHITMTHVFVTQLPLKRRKNHFTIRHSFTGENCTYDEEHQSARKQIVITKRKYNTLECTIGSAKKQRVCRLILSLTWYIYFAGIVGIISSLMCNPWFFGM